MPGEARGESQMGMDKNRQVHFDVNAFTREIMVNKEELSV